MLRALRERLEFTKGLGFRLATLLTVAILPLGLISLVQTLHLLREAERSAEIALLGRTASAAAGERALLQGALGAADALGPAVLETIDNPTACSEVMRGFVERSATFISAAYVPLSGVSGCVSLHGSAVLDFQDSEVYQIFMESRGTVVTALEQGRITGRPVVVVAQPLYDDRDLIGYVVVGLSKELLYSTHSLNFGTEGARILTFSSRGDMLTVDRPFDQDVSGILPHGMVLTDLLDNTDATFRDVTSTGEERAFTVVTVVPGLVYALGSWSPQTAGIAGFKTTRLAAIAIPIALWAVSLLVSYFAVYRLVLRHIRELRGQMRRFAIGNRDAPPPVLRDAPAEIADVSQTFHNMARILIRDEEAMEEAVAEKTVLLKEVHHRVKNNLQLIASIINMQSRMIDHEDAKRVLRSVQDRVAALATIYRNLYQAEHLDAVNADRLIGDIINQMVNISIAPGTALKVETDFQPLTLLPDQAVPLSLLATEAVTNALKYAGIPPGADAATVRVILSVPETGRALFAVENTMGEAIIDSESTGLGSQLIEAFSTQLDGEAETGIEGHRYFLRLLFRVDTQNTPEAGDDRKVVLTSTPREGARH
ncbi:MAG: histidine kinase dimerization/phosphoacceptor domain -containing protein [Paracoccus sp. (in: a-proteobacteria)]|uniref:sensor histidine kinase n=1 Tax=Paracoccus sp. TaxID=267 RepID=UPI0026DF39C2|nr:histidine kinase dimerization/phosphoacceptor domain -containing protein [Paracoccus sp. (in: a-proteobacteria)]MDO5631914.1 histidine kinase dimerization/phosphoacceptor domain -containing protein [Paracoccus sp. (in: a-proteobacteria)]